MAPVMPSGSDLRPLPRHRSPIRVLLATPGWPCGILEVGSWAKRQGLADVVVFQLQPGFLFHLDPDEQAWLSEGVVDPEIVDAFVRRGRPLSPDSLVSRAGPSTWTIRDRRRAWTYRLTQVAEGLEVTVLENLQTEALWAAIRKRADSSRVFQSPGPQEGDGSPFRTPIEADSEPPEKSPVPLAPGAVREAVRAVGSQFLHKLLEFDPHVVGFRLEGGGFEQVQRFVRAVRLFSTAEIVLGGPTATSHPREVLEDTGADYVFAGEAEETFAQFLRLAWQHNSKDRQPEIPGLAYRYGGRTYVNSLPRDGYDRSPLEAESRLSGEKMRRLRNLVRPVAGASVVAGNRLDWSMLEGFRSEFESLFFTGGRGCPGACTFCAKLHGQEVRIKSARQLLEEIEAADACVEAGTIEVSRWPLFAHVDDPRLREKEVAWAAIYDEDFFLHRQRAVEFFRLWDRSPLKDRYRLSLQTNPCSLLTSGGAVHEELLAWIDRLKPMVQLGAESFNPEVLARWHKRHTLVQLNTVLDALDRCRQDYTVFQLLTDFDTTAEELVETLRLLIVQAYRRRRMRIASSPFTIPLYDSDTRPYLEYQGRLAGRIGHFTDYERPQPEWMDPLVAELADLADAELRWTLHLAQRDSALLVAFEVVLARIREEVERSAEHRSQPGDRRSRLEALWRQAQWAMDQIKEERFQGVG